MKARFSRAIILAVSVIVMVNIALVGWYLVPAKHAAYSIGDPSQLSPVSGYAVFVAGSHIATNTMHYGLSIDVGSSKGPFYLENLQVDLLSTQTKDLIFNTPYASLIIDTGEQPTFNLFPQPSGKVIPAGTSYGEVVSKILASVPGAGVSEDPCGNPAVVAFGDTGNSVGVGLIRAGNSGFEGSTIIVLATGCVPGNGSKMTLQLSLFGTPPS